VSALRKKIKRIKVKIVVLKKRKTNNISNLTIKSRKNRKMNSKMQTDFRSLSL